MSSVLIVVPTLGTRETWLRLCLSSIVRQSVVTDIRTIVVSPTSRATAALAAEVGVEHLVCDRPGLSVAINAAWEECGTSTDYFAWLGDDDVLSPISVLATSQHLDRNPGCVAVYGRVRVIGPSGADVFTSRPGRLAAHLLPYGTDQIPQPGSLFRASAVRRAGLLDEDLSYCMDYDLFLKLRRLGSLDYLPLELAAVRTHGGRITQNRTDDGREESSVRLRSLSPKQSARYGRLRPVARAVDRAYTSVLRRMPQDEATRVAGVRYVDPRAADLASARHRHHGPLSTGAAHP